MRSWRSITSAITLCRVGSEGGAGWLDFSVLVFMGWGSVSFGAAFADAEIPPSSFNRLNKAKFSVK